MRFAPKSEDELNPVFEKGEYDAQVKVAEEKTSKKGNPMIQIGLQVWHPDGRTTMVNDYLLESTMAKLLHFCEAAGLRERYDNGDLEDRDCVGKYVRVRLDIEDKPEFGPKNIVKGYVRKDAPQRRTTNDANRAFEEARGGFAEPVKSLAEVAAETPPETDDDIPF